VSRTEVPREKTTPFWIAIDRNVSLRIRLLAAVIAAWLVLSFALFWVLLQFVKPSFVQLESRFAMNDLARIQGAFTADLESLGNSAKDYSTWDEMYTFVKKPSNEFIATNLHESMLNTLKIDLFVIFDDRDRAVFSRAGSPTTGIPHHFLETDPVELKTRIPILTRTQGPRSIESSKRSGTFRLFDGNLIEIAASPVLKSDGSGPVGGTVVMGRLITDDALTELRRRTKLDFEIITKFPLDIVPTDDYPRVTQGKQIVVTTIWKDLTNTPIARLKLARAASIVDQGKSTLIVASVSALVVLSVVMMILLGVIQFFVVSPLGRLSQTVDSIHSSGNLDVRLALERNDEIGTLARSFDKLLVILGERATKLKYLATIDELTEVYNRRAIMDQLHQEIERALRYELSLAILLIDIDYFKRVNDTDGHAIGDRVLRSVARTLKSELRETDTVGRYGGEEFLVVMPHQTREGACIVAERLRTAVENGANYGASTNVTISTGVAVWENYTREALLFIADRNLYAAKNEGRNRVVSRAVSSENLPKPSMAAMRAHSKRPSLA
jgi:diguanylate cyclase (GGDEF)-like protein